MNGIENRETAIIEWHIDSNISFRLLPFPSEERKNAVSKTYPTTKDETTVLAARTLYIVDIVW